MVFRFLVYFLSPIFMGALTGYRNKHEVQASWYTSLRKPAFNPPNWIYAPMWTAMYVAMGLAAYRVAQVNQNHRSSFTRERAHLALQLYWFQLVLNLLWSPCFFAWHAIATALIDISLLWVFVFLTMATFFQVDTLAGWLFVPYLAWTTFATLLNYGFWDLNCNTTKDGTYRPRARSLEPVPSSHAHSDHAAY
ncbi:TspO/MBR family-domain-containing protein [Dimargaris cristalligena]|uniref:TspO/MBR family-domain-containing protein n=1 Tax=Dimargaris cristalligena TaxID=215637 RepID=A0A4V1J483_9FUNG|nr:TspO/MBR family-domain-containing protein [Dimargaris cristalligena]|eukprot:RKP34659.1 TspO/MBR family-domain-containing protein [Dimargaris cristalligena]